jgi:uncharacterized protein (TIGR03083 family)
MSETNAWINAVRNSHERLVGLLASLDAEEVSGQSYDTEWTIADVASHLGSQAEIFGAFLDAGLNGTEPLSGADFGPIWDRWNALPPTEQVAASITADTAFIARLDRLTPAEAATFSMSLFGTELDLDGFLRMRLGEHAIHTWDVGVALDPTTELAPDAVELLIDTLAELVPRVGSPAAEGRVVVIETHAPARDFLLSTGPEVQLSAGVGTASPDLQMPAAALLRLVYGRLDPAHTPPSLASSELVAELRAAFPGF